MRKMTRALERWVWLCFIPLLPASALSAPITWIGGNADWVDGAGNNPNWNPADEPDADDTAIFNTPNSVNLGTNNTIQALTMSGGIDLNANNFDLTVGGLVQLVDADTNLFVGGSAATLLAHSVTINNGADLEMTGGVLTMNDPAVLGLGLFDINAGGELRGHGTVNLNDAVASAATLLVNDGAISAARSPLIFSDPPPLGTLAINSSDSDARIDLDGTGENGVVNVFRNQTLDINVSSTETFDGDINLFHNATFDWASSWTLASGTIDVNNGFVNGTLGFPDVPAGVSIIRGSALTQTGGTITVADTDGTLRFNSDFTMSGGTLTNNGLVIFDADALIDHGANFSLATAGASFTVAEQRTVQIQQTNFNLDGVGAAGTSVITVNEAGLLEMLVIDYETDAGANAFDGTITLNSGDISINTADAEFVMDGTLNLNNTFAGINPSFNVNSEPLDIGNDLGIRDAKVNVGGTPSGSGVSQIFTEVDFNSDADVNVAADATLQFATFATVNFNTVNGANNAEFTGAGTIRFGSTVNVNEAVTLNMVGGTVDLDGSDAVGDFINIDAPLVINAATMDSFGRMNSAGGPNTLDINNSVGTGVLTVNLDNATDEWTLNAVGVMNLVNDNAPATLLAGSDVNLNGTVNVTGDVRIDARVDIGNGNVNIMTTNEPLRLAGGNESDDTNTLSGGTINGPGLLAADTGSALHGFGTINANIDFDGGADLRADNGILTVNGAILDVSQLGTADDDGILNIPAAWNTGVNISSVFLRGGEIRGGTITNDGIGGIAGFGLIASRLINNAHLTAGLDGTLVVQTAANDNDWDGTTNAGQLNAAAGNLEIRDNTLFNFLGSAQISPNRELFVNGFELRWQPGSSIALSPQGRLRLNASSTRFGGAITVDAGAPAVIQANNFTIESTATVAIAGTLRLENAATQIDFGATFSGAGILLNAPGFSSLRLADAADVDVLIQNQAQFVIGQNVAAQATGLAFQQDSTGGWTVELAGLGLNEYDRFNLTGATSLAGTLEVELLDGFAPGVGDEFDILTGASRTGEFNRVDGYLGEGLFLAPVYGPDSFSLLTTQAGPGDTDLDGDVDLADLGNLATSFGLSNANIDWLNGDFDGDNDVDLNDLGTLASNFGAGRARAFAEFGALVPEPAAVLIFVLLSAMPRRKRHATT